MPLKDKEQYKSYMNDYMKKRYEKRRLQAIEDLGGTCAQCTETKELEFDHVDPKTKTMSIARAASLSEVRWQAELAKCQLLCVEHHKAKTRNQRSKGR